MRFLNQKLSLREEGEGEEEAAAEKYDGMINFADAESS